MSSNAGIRKVSCAVIVVTHNSLVYLLKCLESVAGQTALPEQIIIVDSGSSDVDSLREIAGRFGAFLHVSGENIGFCAANNVGLSFVDRNCESVLFLNPDAFLMPHFIAYATAHLNHPTARDIGALSGLLAGYDMKNDRPTGAIDSTGIFRTCTGRWVDRGRGEKIAETSDRFGRAEFVPALCGALMFCRMSALRSVEFDSNVVFDPSFYMYKEDIDLSLRLRRKGWKLLFVPGTAAYHCRGWNCDRRLVSRKFRLLSARNEIRLYARRFSPYTISSACKYLAVKLLDC